MRALYAGLFALAILGTVTHAFAQETSITRQPSAPTPEETAAEAEPPRSTSDWTGLPIVSYAPETGLALGGFGVHYFRLGDAPRSARASYLALAATYTTRNQALVDFIPVLWFGPTLSHAERTRALRDIARSALSDADRMRQFERYSLTGQFAYRRFPDSFFGIGNQTDVAAEERYLMHSFWDLLDLRARIAGPFFVGVRQEFQVQEVELVNPDGLLSRGVSGVPGGIRSGLGVTLVYDSRDNTQSPREGAFHQLSFVAFQSFLGSDYHYVHLNLDLRQYVRLAPQHTLAFQLYADMNAGDVPFNQLALLGGAKMMRGYFEGRFRDKDYLMTQVEYRIMPVYWRIGAVVFASIGEVAERIQDFTFGGLHWSVGAGLRYALDVEERIYVRADVGFAIDSWGLYVNVLEAF